MGSLESAGFNEEEEEAADTAFFQRGRFFGLSAGLGYQGAVGNLRQQNHNTP